MYDREFAITVVEAARATTHRAAADRFGLPKSTVSQWATGRLPHERSGKPRRGRPAGSGSIRRRKWRPSPEARMPVDKREQRAYEQALEEIRALRAVLDVLKARGSTSTAQRIAFAERASERAGVSLSKAAGMLGVSRQLLSYHRNNPRRDRDARLRPLVAEAFEECGRRGYRAVHATLANRGTRVSEKRVRRIMRELGLAPVRKRGRRYSSYAGEVSEAPPNAPLREDGTHCFAAEAPGELLVSDITEFRLPDGSKAYLSPVVDCFDGMPLSWSISRRPDAELANSSLEGALASLPEGSRPVVHTDRGCHYRWPGWRGICERHGAARSMSRKGTSPDNARMEGFFGTLKQEFFYSRGWEGVGVSEFMEELDGWLRWFVGGRIKQSLGWRTYAEHRTELGLADTLPLAV